ncbi:MAG: cation:proton antiporter [Actinobacteria bacterium]|nr:cation:proton antiporter [Actinomycetota bacterium]
MVHLPELPLTDAAWLFVAVMTAILVAPIIARWLRLPVLVTLVLLGMVAGPGALGLLEREGPLEIIGEAGLLYLMFVAGLELDLKEFTRRRAHALGFGFAGFALPMLIGTAVIALMGFELLAALLLASCWASHTLLTYPTFRTHGAAKNRAVATSVGATILTDISALLVLVVVVQANAGDLGPSLWLTLAAGFAALAVLASWVLPRVGKSFFATFGDGRNPRFIFAMLAMFGLAAVGELAGIEAIVGAFLAGLGLNKLVPAGSPLMHRIEFVGDAFMIPIFLLSVGLLIEPAVLVSPKVLAVAAGFTAIALGTKFLAAYGVGRVLKFERSEIGAMYALTSAQAAATLAAAMIGVQAEIIDAETLNAVVVVILVTCLVSTSLAARYAPQLPQDQRPRRLAETVIVPIADPDSSEGLVGLASLLAADDAGLVVPVTVAPPEAGPEQLQRIRDIAARADEMVLATGGESEAVLRIDASPSAGIVNAMVERQGTMLVLGWTDRRVARRAIFGDTVDSVLAKVPAPILVARLDDGQPRRLVLVVAESNLRGAGQRGLRLAVEVCRRIREGRTEGDAPEVVVVTTTEDDELRELVERELEVEVTVDRRRRTAIAADLAADGDLFVVPFRPERRGLRGDPSEVARALGSTPLIAVLDHSGALPHTVGEAHDEVVDERLEDRVETIQVRERGTPTPRAVEAGVVEGDEDDDPTLDELPAASGDGQAADQTDEEVHTIVVPEIASSGTGRD